MIKKLLYIILLSTIFGKQITIKFVDIITEHPIENVQINTDNNSKYYSDFNGELNIEDKDINQLVIEKKGYHSIFITPPFSQLVQLKPILFKHDLIVINESILKADKSIHHPTQLIKYESKIKSVSQVQQMFEQLPGISIKSYGGIGGVKTLSLNGSQGDRIQLLFNGININNEQSGNADISQLPIGLLNNLQFIPVGSSSRYGNSAMAGVINISAKQDNVFSLNFNKIQNGYSINQSSTFQFKKIKLGYHLGSFKANQIIDWNENGNYNPDMNTHKNYNWFSSGIIQNYLYNWASISTLNYSYNVFSLSTNNRRNHSSKIYGPEYHPTINDGIFLIGSSLNFQRFKNKTSYKEQWINFNSISSYTPPIHAIHKLKVLKNDVEISFKNISIFNQLIQTQSKSNSTSPKDTTSIQSHLGFTFRNINPIINTFFSYRIAHQKYVHPIQTYEIILQKFFTVLPINSSIIFSRNYKQPNFNDLYWQPFGNKNLQTEYSNNFYFSNHYSWKNIKVDFLSHYIIYKNMIQWLPKPGTQNYWSPENIHSATSNGYSIMIDFNPPSTLNGKISISHNNTLNNLKNEKIPYTPNWIIGSHLSAKYHHFNLLFSHQYQSNRELNIPDHYGENRTIPSYHIFNFTLSKEKKINKLNLQTNLVLNNFTNTRFQSVYGYPEMGRTIEIQIKITKE